MGRLEGLFIAYEEDVKNAIGELANFGEVLGKHSNIKFELHHDDFEIIDKATDRWLLDTEEMFESCNLSGYNPLDYVEFGEEE